MSSEERTAPLRRRSIVPTGGVVIPPGGYQSDSEESEYSITDSVHYSDWSDMEDTLVAPPIRPRDTVFTGTYNDDPNHLPIEDLSDLPPVPRPLSDGTPIAESSHPIPYVTYGDYRIFFDMEIDGNFVGRVIISFTDRYPRCRNHLGKLCAEEYPQHGRLMMRYTGTRFHRCVPGKFLEGGVLHPLVPELTPSVYEDREVENPQFYGKYIMVANMAIDDPYGGGRFFITTSDTVKHCDTRMVPLGVVVSGREVVDKMATVEFDPVTGNFRQAITISHCGAIKPTNDEICAPGRFEKKRDTVSNSFLTKLYNRREIPRVKAAVVNSDSPNGESSSRKRARKNRRRAANRQSTN
ncbi:unnamed protein product [Caenorhabditis sp. 36 PRJEB53466]|nr:unnamed protein product [Caenorhabditis sp. 36 PRJEB53466]